MLPHNNNTIEPPPLDDPKISAISSQLLQIINRAKERVSKADDHARKIHELSVRDFRRQNCKHDVTRDRNKSKQKDSEVDGSATTASSSSNTIQEERATRSRPSLLDIHTDQRTSARKLIRALIDQNENQQQNYSDDSPERCVKNKEVIVEKTKPQSVEDDGDSTVTQSDSVNSNDTNAYEASLSFLMRYNDQLCFEGEAKEELNNIPEVVDTNLTSSRRSLLLGNEANKRSFRRLSSSLTEKDFSGLDELSTVVPSHKGQCSLTTSPKKRDVKCDDKATLSPTAAPPGEFRSTQTDDEGSSTDDEDDDFYGEGCAQNLGIIRRVPMSEEDDVEEEEPDDDFPGNLKEDPFRISLIANDGMGMMPCWSNTVQRLPNNIPAVIHIDTAFIETESKAVRRKDFTTLLMKAKVDEYENWRKAVTR